MAPHNLQKRLILLLLHDLGQNDACNQFEYKHFFFCQFENLFSLFKSICHRLLTEDWDITFYQIDQDIVMSLCWSCNDNGIHFNIFQHIKIVIKSLTANVLVALSRAGAYRSETATKSAPTERTTFSQC